MFKTKSLATFSLHVSVKYFYLFLLRATFFFFAFSPPQVLLVMRWDVLKYSFMDGIYCKSSIAVVDACVAEMDIFVL